MGISQPVRPAARQRCFKFCQHVEASPCGFGRFVLEGMPGTHTAKTAAQGFDGVQGAGAVDEWFIDAAQWAPQATEACRRAASRCS